MDQELFVACSLRDLIPEDYILKRVDRVLDLSWLREEVGDLYCADNGRPSIDPEAAVRLMLAGFFHGIVHDRKLMREARMHVGMRWFAGFALHEELPDHSSLTRLRHRWMVEGRHGEAKTQHGLARAVRRGLDNVRIQAYLTAATMNLKRLARSGGKTNTPLAGRRGRLREVLRRIARVARLIRPMGCASRLRFA